jgi:hypothetical protein
MFNFTANWPLELQAAAIGALVGGFLGILGALLGALLGGWVQGMTWYGYEQQRSEGERRSRAVQAALSWAANGRQESLQRADLHDADLRGIDLSRPEEGGKGADLSYGNLAGADMVRAKMEGAELVYADLVRVRLDDANLIYANLRRAKLAGARYSNSTDWPEGFDPPEGTIKVADE